MNGMFECRFAHIVVRWIDPFRSCTNKVLHRLQSIPWCRPRKCSRQIGTSRFESIAVPFVPSTKPFDVVDGRTPDKGTRLGCVEKLQILLVADWIIDATRCTHDNTRQYGLEWIHRRLEEEIKHRPSCCPRNTTCQKINCSALCWFLPHHGGVDHCFRFKDGPFLSRLEW